MAKKRAKKSRPGQPRGNTPKPKLAVCPCGKEPETLVIELPVARAKWGTVTGDCCGMWTVEFRNSFKEDPDETMKLAREYWNAAPRGGMK